MLNELKARILSDLWASKMSIVKLEQDIGEKEGFFIDFLSDTKKETLPPTVLKRIADVFNKPYIRYAFLKPGLNNAMHSFAVNITDKLNDLTRSKVVTWEPIDKNFSLKTDPDLLNATIVAMSDEKAEKTISLDYQSNLCHEAGPAFCGKLDDSEWKIYLTCVYTHINARFYLSRNVYFVDERGHVVDYIEPFMFGNNIDMVYLEEDLTHLYCILLKYFDRMMYLCGTDEDED